jgi:hypothetical protein
MIKNRVSYEAHQSNSPAAVNQAQILVHQFLTERYGFGGIFGAFART